MGWEPRRGGDLVLTYTYDAAGRRIAKTELGVTTKYYWDGDKIIGLKQGNDRMQFVYDEKGNLFSMRLNGATYYYLFNGQNDVLGLIDSAGNQVVSYIYNSWGKPLSVTDTSGKSVGSKNPFRYRGYCYDEETGFYYVSSRYYDPEVGRFISADTTDILEVQDDLYDKNLYAYCDNNPVMRVDSSGAVWHLAVGAVVGVATQFVADVGIGLATGSSFGEVISSLSPVDYASAAIGGVAGAIGGSGANGKNMRGVYSRSKQVINATKSARKQTMYKAKITTIKKNVTKSSVRTAVAGVFSNVGNFVRRLFSRSKA